MTYHVKGDAAARKAVPVCTGLVDYFPDALIAVAELSRIGNDQHSPGQPLHWAKDKSTDEADALMRHLIDRGKLDADGVRHTAKVAWRALALLQREIEAEEQAILVPEDWGVSGRRAPIVAAEKVCCPHCGGNVHWEDGALTGLHGWLHDGEGDIWVCKEAETDWEVPDFGRCLLCGNPLTDKSRDHSQCR